MEKGGKTGNNLKMRFNIRVIPYWDKMEKYSIWSENGKNLRKYPKGHPL
tara:strand:+ start:578 stop:724 length:147 start_codon:yes stop_codon:yes gene_type:complete